jgi:DNA ligase-1
MSAQWIERLNASDSRLHKEDVLKQALTAATLGDYGSQVFLGLTNAAYNPMITWGIKQVPNTVGIVDAENPWDDFNALLNDLRLRVLTGNAAREAISSMSQRFNSNDWNDFCAAVLRKDLRSGISDKTINKVCKGTNYQVPVFSCQLATSCEDRPEMRGSKRLEPKLDGVRVLMLCTISDDGGRLVTSYSRNGKVFENFGHIEEQLMSVMEPLSVKTGCTSFVLDGEVVGNTFQELMKQARRKENVQATDSTFHVFDFIPLTDFINGYWNAKLSKRLLVLEKIRSVIENLRSVKLLSHIKVDLDTASGREQLDRYANDCVAQGFEGIMIKNLDAPYECKRNTFWLKWKPIITVDLKVIDIEEGTGRNIDRMGALVCSGTDQDKQISVNVGSGFSDEQRHDFWINRNFVIGQTAEILADAVTRNQDGTYSLRFPRFFRFREDK